MELPGGVKNKKDRNSKRNGKSHPAKSERFQVETLKEPNAKKKMNENRKVQSTDSNWTVQTLHVESAPKSRLEHQLSSVSKDGSQNLQNLAKEALKTKLSNDTKLIEDGAISSRNNSYKNTKLPHTPKDFKGRGGGDSNFKKIGDRKNFKGGKKPTAMQRAQQVFNLQQQRKAEQIQRRKEEQEAKKAKIAQNVSKRKENFKTYNRKTSKGQPIMAVRMGLLLEKIQRDMVQ